MRPASRKPVQKPTGHERPAQATTTGRKHPQKKNDNWTRARAPASPKKPREAPENPRKPKGTQGTPEGPKKPASTKRLSRRHVSTRHASQKLPTGQLNTSARPGHDYWTQAPPKRATTGRTRPSKTTIMYTSTNHNDQDAPGCPKKPQETLREPARTPQETTRGPRKPQEVPRTQASNQKCVANLGSPRSMHERPRR